ncbi:MAG: RHS repeat-associated core domain-containing protein [Cytophagales bacterium]|nr:RHS repeat-associated core domain-containing protein [Cytophagales bacterium]
MACPKLLYDHDQESLPFLEVWKKERLENTDALFLGTPGEKSRAENFCDSYLPFGMAFNSWTSGTENLYKFTGYEEQKETALIDFGWRNYDPALGRFNSIDLFSDKYYDLNPYQYAANNPLKYVDIKGDSLMLFKNGVYVTTVDNGKEEITGFNQESTIDEDGKEMFTGGQSFSFNDIDLDKEGAKTTRLNFISNEDVSNIISESGVKDQNVLSRWLYAANESTATDAKPNAKMDFQGDERIKYHGVNIINGVAYNHKDAGNYFWGYAMGAMGFTSLTARSAAHYFAWGWGKLTNPGMASTNSNPIMRWFENRSWGGDSAADQRAIQNGLNDSGSYWENKKKSFKKWP